MSIHHLKIKRQPFEDLVSGRKTGEVRSCADREFREGDQVELFLIDETGNPANKSIVRTITHIQRGYGLPDDVCVLSYANHTDEPLGLVAAPAVERQEPACYVVKDRWGVNAYLEEGSEALKIRRRLGFTDEIPLYTSPPAPVAEKYDDVLNPFVALMRKELHANADKGDRPGWLLMSSDTALLEIIYHFGKLQASVKRGDEDGIREYAADVANMCMMLTDVCACLDKVKELNK